MAHHTSTATSEQPGAVPHAISCLRAIRMPLCVICGFPSAVYCGGCINAPAYCCPAHFRMVCPLCSLAAPLHLTCPLSIGQSTRFPARPMLAASPDLGMVDRLVHPPLDSSYCKLRRFETPRSPTSHRQRIALLVFPLGSS